VRCTTWGDAWLVIILAAFLRRFGPPDGFITRLKLVYKTQHGASSYLGEGRLLLDWLWCRGRGVVWRRLPSGEAICSD
jgi:hypothetical protein